MEFILVPLIVGALAQLMKFTSKSIKNKRLSHYSWLSYGGWPSVHTATVVSLLTVIWLSSGYNSPEFAVALVFSTLTVRDALGLRRYLGEHGQVLNKLIADMPNKHKKNGTYPKHLREHLGHSIFEVVSGGIIGCLLTWAIYIWFF